MPDNLLDTTTVMQVGIIVRDIEAKARAWAQLLGLPAPEIIITDPAEQAQTEYKGQRTLARAKLAFFRLGQVALELIEPLDGPSTWRDQLEAQGESVHHIAFGVHDMQDKLAGLASEGIPLIQKGEHTGGRYAYVDSGAALGVILELLEDD
jgi:methylmalonyl-CoA/ethylmalonyl-CoA epimerase